jgi:phage tail protein X
VADNLLIPISGGTATVRTEDNAGVHTQGLVLCNSDGTVLTSLPVVVDDGDINIVTHVNINDEVYASAARTATPTAVEMTNLYHRGVLIYAKVTAATSTPSVVPTLRFKDEVTNDWITIDTYAALTGVSTATYYVHPSAPTGPTFTDTTQVSVPRVWSLLMTHADSDSITYSVGAIYLA